MGRILRVLWPRGWWRWLLVGGAAFVVLNVAAVEITSQSWFCNSCHIMNPYYASWKTSTHKNVDCVNCHIPPGAVNFVSAKLNGAGQVVDDLLSRTSTKPSASVSDMACTRSGCHDIGKVRASARRDGRYFFDHAKHLDMQYKGILVACSTCHSHIQGNKHFEINTNACVTCHLVKPEAAPGAAAVQLVSMGSSASPASAPTMLLGAKQSPNQCKSCHAPPTKAIEYNGLKVVHADYTDYGAACESCHSGVTDKPQKVNDDSCFSCHEFGLEKLGSVQETHKVHSSGRHKVECFSCHGVTRHGPSAQSMKLDQIDCQACHTGQHAIQQKAYKAVDMVAHQPVDAAAVSPMFMVHVACTGCHVEKRPLTVKPLSGATVSVATAKACDNCHKPGMGEQTVPLWQKATHTLYDGAMKLMPAATMVLTDQQQLKVNQAKGLLELVRLDGSWGAHNPRYTQKLLEDAQQKLLDLQPGPTTKGSK